MSPKTALLVIDMQTYFIPSAQHPHLFTTTIPNIKSLISVSHSHGIKVLFTQHGHAESEFLPPPEDAITTNQIVKRWGHQSSVHIGTPDWEFIDEIADIMKIAGGKEESIGGSQGRTEGKTEGKGEEGDAVVLKNTYDAFASSDLEGMLKSEEVGKVIVCGVLTNACVEGTARSAFDRGFDTW
ncbi:hypothetical protein ABW19_dt0200370 [Dactylella cylindrospora]|nr:hypothetical protein ABW19_dt0200370 [Dactylella cylindrospora]